MQEISTLLEYWCSMKRLNIPVTDFRARLAGRTIQHLASSIVVSMSDSDASFLLNSGMAIATLFQTEASLPLVSSPKECSDDQWGIDMSDSMPLIPSFKLVSSKSESENGPGSSTSGNATGFRIVNVWKFAFLFGLLACIGFAMVFIQIWSDGKTLQNANGTALVPLHDIVYDEYLPDFFKTLPESLIDPPIGMGVPASLLFSAWVSGRQDPTRLGRRSLLTLIALYTFRTLSIAVTQVPPSNPAYCRPFPATLQEYWPAAIAMFASKTKSCSDMMFSGHTGILSVVLMRIWYDSGSTGIRAFPRLLIRGIACSLYLLSVLMFIGVRLHYTMDVLIGAVIGFSWAISFENTFLLLPIYAANDGVVLSIFRWVESAPEPVSMKKIF
ncbi:hypothetical protein HDU98_011032 [Podochytrium sp. JEL0797]|nr:hypothetical protein HDU98_011032 [Podochytrium sp. JEL0797]